MSTKYISIKHKGTQTNTQAERSSDHALLLSQTAYIGHWKIKTSVGRKEETDPSQFFY